MPKGRAGTYQGHHAAPPWPCLGQPGRSLWARLSSPSHFLPLPPSTSPAALNPGLQLHQASPTCWGPTLSLLVTQWCATTGTVLSAQLRTPPHPLKGTFTNKRWAEQVSWTISSHQTCTEPQTHLTRTTCLTNSAPKGNSTQWSEHGAPEDTKDSYPPQSEKGRKGEGHSPGPSDPGMGCGLIQDH